MRSTIQFCAKSVHATVFAVALALIFAFPARGVDLNPEQKEAIKAAEDFLQLVDTGQYEASWETTAPIFQSQVSREKWVEKISGVRPLFGETIS